MVQGRLQRVRESALGEDTVSLPDALCRGFARTGVIYDPTVQTCIFDAGWSADTNDDNHDINDDHNHDIQGKGRI